MHVSLNSSFMAREYQRKNDAVDGLEQAFLNEILKHTGPKESKGGFGGGIGEAQFHSMLNEVYAESMARRLDLRLSKGLENEDV